MTFEEAKKLNLDVFTFANNEVGEAGRAKFAAVLVLSGRTVVTFEEVVHAVTLRCLAVGPRPDAGEISKHMKENRKRLNEKQQTARDFIQGE
jgi:hypothetical protein